MGSDDARETGTERLWTPWRIPYVGGAKESGCIFCNRLHDDDDVGSLIIHRADDAFVIMNLFPYNTGHVMLVPNLHVSSPEDAPESTSRALATVRRPILRALRRALGCDGFNLGLNIGAVAGAGVAEHMHEHVVPRWTGDANFMPILASTMVLPELIPVTYAKLRAELARELNSEDEDALLVIVDATAERVFVEEPSGRLPRQQLVAVEPVWKSAIAAALRIGLSASVVGWAGEQRAGSPQSPALTLRAEPFRGDLQGGTWARLHSDDAIQGDDLVAARRAIRQIAPFDVSR